MNNLACPVTKSSIEIVLSELGRRTTLRWWKAQGGGVSPEKYNPYTASPGWRVSRTHGMGLLYLEGGVLCFSKNSLEGSFPIVVDATLFIGLVENVYPKDSPVKVSPAIEEKSDGEG